MIRIGIIVVMAVPVADPIREIHGCQASIHRLNQGDIVHSWGRSQGRERAQHHREGDDEAKTGQEGRSRHAEDLI
jgi:hypothetical protein